MKLAIVTKLYGRERLTRLFLAYYMRLHVPHVTLSLHAAYTPGADDYVLGYDAWQCTPVANEPLSDGWNAAVESVSPTNPDAVLLIGSDDFLSLSALRGFAAAALAGYHFVVPQSLYVFDAWARRLAYCETPRVGAARLLSRHALGKVQWRPFQEGVNQGTDGAMDRQMRWAGFEPDHQPEGRHLGILDVKTLKEDGTPANMWSYDHLRTNRGVEQWSGAHALCELRAHFPSLADSLYTFHDT